MKIFITGAGSGIGHDTAINLAEQGHYVIAGVETVKQFEELEKELDNTNLGIKVVKCDITNFEDRESIAKNDIDILINNAGIGESGPISTIPIELVKKNADTNVYGTLALTQLFIPKMVKKKHGRIIIVSSVVGKLPFSYVGAYAMTKHTLEAMGDTLRQELSCYGIKVSIIEPGAIATGFNERMIATKYKWWKPSEVFGNDEKKIKSYEKGLLKKQYSTDSVVKAISHAVNAKAQKSRYVIPFKYKIILFFTKLFPDKLKDKIIDLSF